MDESFGRGTSNTGLYRETGRAMEEINSGRAKHDREEAKGRKETSHGISNSRRMSHGKQIRVPGVRNK